MAKLRNSNAIRCKLEPVEYAEVISGISIQITFYQTGASQWSSDSKMTRDASGIEGEGKSHLYW